MKAELVAHVVLALTAFTGAVAGAWWGASGVFWNPALWLSLVLFVFGAVLLEYSLRTGRR